MILSILKKIVLVPFFPQIFNFIPFISISEEKARRPLVLEKTSGSGCIPLRGEIKYHITNVDVKSKIVTFASQHIIEFNSVYNKTEFSMFWFEHTAILCMSNATYSPAKFLENVSLKSHCERPNTAIL